MSHDDIVDMSLVPTSKSHPRIPCFQNDGHGDTGQTRHEVFAHPQGEFNSENSRRMNKPNKDCGPSRKADFRRAAVTYPETTAVHP